jgi:tetratricopeptide (TPR) repeat protein
MLASIDWSQPTAYLQLETFARMLWAALIFIAIVAAVVRGTRQEQALDDRPAPWILSGLLIGLGVFFIHNLMDFVLMEAGAMTIFAIVLGAALGVRTPSAAGQKKRRRVAIAAFALASIAWIAGVAIVVIPVADAEQRAADGDAAVRANRPVHAAELYTSAARIVPWNADYYYRAARAWTAVPGSAPENVKSMLTQAIAVDPANVTYHRTRAQYELARPNPDPQLVRADFDRILQLDPKNLSAILDYAQTLEKLGDPKAAAEQYRNALEVNKGYDKTEPKRLPAEEVERIERTIANLSSEKRS